MKITQHAGKYFGTGDRLLKSRFSNWTMIALLAFYGCAVENESIPSRQSAASQTHETSQQAVFFLDNSISSGAETPAVVYVEIDGKKVPIIQGGPPAEGVIYKYVTGLTPEQHETITRIVKQTKDPNHYLYGLELDGVRVPQDSKLDPVTGAVIKLSGGGIEGSMSSGNGKEIKLYQQSADPDRIGSFWGNPNQSGDDNKTYKNNNCWLDEWGASKAAYETFVKIPPDGKVTFLVSEFAEVGDGKETIPGNPRLQAQKPKGGEVIGPAFGPDGAQLPGWRLAQIAGEGTNSDAFERARVVITTSEIPEGRRGPEAKPPTGVPDLVRDYSQSPRVTTSPDVTRSRNIAGDPDAPRSGATGGSNSARFNTAAQSALGNAGAFYEALTGMPLAPEIEWGINGAGALFDAGMAAYGAGGGLAGAGAALGSIFEGGAVVLGSVAGVGSANGYNNAFGTNGTLLGNVITTVGGIGGAAVGGYGSGLVMGAMGAPVFVSGLASSSTGALAVGASTFVTVGLVGAVAVGAGGLGYVISENIICPFITLGEASAATKAYNESGFAAGTPPTKCSCLTQDCTPGYLWNSCKPGKTTEMIVPDQASCNQQNGQKFDSTIGGVTSYTVRLQCSSNSPSPSGSPYPDHSPEGVD